jgi:thiamine pyrophosphokinase
MKCFNYQKPKHFVAWKRILPDDMLHLLSCQVLKHCSDVKFNNISLKGAFGERYDHQITFFFAVLEAPKNRKALIE